MKINKIKRKNKEIEITLKFIQSIPTKNDSAMYIIDYPVLNIELHIPV